MVFHMDDFFLFLLRPRLLASNSFLHTTAVPLKVHKIKTEVCVKNLVNRCVAQDGIHLILQSDD